MDLIDINISCNFSVVVESATDFFADDEHYWGLCEEIMVVPGTLVSQSETHVWRFKFHLVAEGERWVLLLSTSGELLHSVVENIPCQECTDWTTIIIISSLLGAVGIFAILIYFNRNKTK
jgi:hypothetical protein